MLSKQTQISFEAENVRHSAQVEQRSPPCFLAMQERPVPFGICIRSISQRPWALKYAPGAVFNPGDGQMIARIQPLLPDRIRAAAVPSLPLGGG